MAKGTRGGKIGGGTANKENNKTISMNANNTDHSANNNHAKGATKSRGRDKQKIVEEESVKAIPPVDENQSNDVNNIKKDHHKQQVQPTSTQIMLAQLIGGENMDDVQRNKIQQVMDITGKQEDAVATALFDASWDENRAIELLLEDGDNLRAWEETGKKGKKKQKQNADEGKDEMEDSDTFNGEFRDKSKRGPPRMRRGGAASQGGDRSASRSNKGDMQFVNGGGFDQSGRGRGDQPPRRGGRGGGTAGGGRAGRGGRRGGGGNSRDGMGGPGNGSIPSGTEVGFSGSIDTWNPNGSSGDGSGDAGSANGTSGPRQRRGGQNSKDAFDNAGNWGDDFPAADDWDNEEYTGSLADTKVFTASGQPTARKDGGGKHPSPPKQQQPQRGSNYSQESQPVSASSTVPAPSSAAVGAPAAAYSQSIDLSTLLHKPTTQSSIGSNSQSLLQFTQQATDSLKAAVGIGQPSPAASSAAAGKSDMSYSSYASASAGGSSGARSGYDQGSSAFTSIKPTQQQAQVGKQGQAGSGAPRSRMPPPSKIPNSAVEMPGDQLGRLDVQFGGLDLQFVGGGAGGAGSANGADSVNSFEFNGGTGTAAPSSAATSDDKKATTASTTAAAAAADSYHPPSAKEVNKSLSNAMSTAGKLGGTDGFSDVRKPAAAAPGGSGSSYRGGVDMSAGSKVTNDALGGYHAGSTQSGYNYGGNSSHSKSYGHHPYGSNSSNQYGGAQHYGNSGTGYNQSNYSASSAATTNNYTKSASNYDKTGFSSDNAQSASVSNNASAVLGLTSTTNALSGKISATSASKVVPNLPPGVAAGVMPQHYMPAGLPPAAFYGLQQPAAAMYSAAYGNAGLEDLAALQRASGLHTLQAGYYDPSSQYNASSLAQAAASNRGDASTNMSSLSSSAASTSGVGSMGNVSTNSISGHSSSAGVTSAASDAAKSAFGNVVSANDSTSSPIPSSTHQTQQGLNAQATLNFAATNAFAAQQQPLPPGYAYFYGQIPNVQAAYGGASMYPPTAMAVATNSGNTQNQFPKTYGTSYGSTGYDTLGQQGNKDFGSSYSGNSTGKSSGAGGTSGGGGAGKGHQYWGNQLW